MINSYQLENDVSMNYREELERIKTFHDQGHYDVVIKNAGTVYEVALRELYRQLIELTPPEKLERMREAEFKISHRGKDYQSLGLGSLVRLFREAAVFDRLAARSGKDYKAVQGINLGEMVDVQARNRAVHHGQKPDENQSGITYYSLQGFLKDCHLLGLRPEEQSERENRYHYSLLRFWSKGYISPEETDFLAALAAENELSHEQILRLTEQVKAECRLAIESYQANKVVPFEPPPERDYVTQRHNLPSVLASQLRHGLSEYLKATFPMTTPAFSGLLDRFMAQPGKLFKGPYVSVQLPFQRGRGKKQYFPELHLGFVPYLHQEMAFARLSDGKPRPTLVATGTGSGKTECFLYPVLDHCYQHRGEGGIKAILIYPMNALAGDQARRIADQIWNNPELKGKITAGLYVGDKPAQLSSSMQPQGIITDRETIRNAPPDILLTNYKMLDYMLTRPQDFGLWRDNTPETLQYLVVDELHTFDGAQGTDLACLIRRLKARLKSPPDHLCPVGTSATLGTESSPEILAFASKIFGETFDEEALITEQRQPLHEFLGDAMLMPSSLIPKDWEQALDPEHYGSYAEFIQAQYKLWFGQPLPETAAQQDWRARLGEELKSHLFFQNFLRALKAKALTYDELLESLQGYHPELKMTSERFKILLLNSLIALISSARSADADDPDKLRPFLNVRSQFWVREMSRLVASVSPDQPELSFDQDLRQGHHSQLPLVHCRECHNVAWGASQHPRHNALNPALETFYQNFFNGRQDTQLIYPDPNILGQNTLAPGIGQTTLCTSCLAYGERESEILHQPACEHPQLMRVCKVTPFTENKQKSKNCLVCGGENALFVIGHRASSLTSVLIGQLFASHYSDDKKIIAFSDSVQDASYRAGFFTARTYQLMLRAALQQYLDQCDEDLTLPEVITGFCDYWLAKKGEIEFIASFLPADLVWLEDYEALLRDGALPEASNLVDIVRERLGWEIYREYSFRTRIGRSLEKSGNSMLNPDPKALKSAYEQLLLLLPDEVPELFPERDLSPDHPRALRLLAFLRAFLRRTKEIGAVYHSAINNVFTTGIRFGIYASKKSLHHLRPIWLSGQGNFGGPRPLSLTSTDFELLHSHSRITWYQWLAEAYLVDEDQPMAISEIREFYQRVLDVLTKQGLLMRWDHAQQGATWAIDPAQLRLITGLRELRCSTCSHTVTVPAKEMLAWQGQPCIKRPCHTGHYQPLPASESYYSRFYEQAQPERIFAHEHTGLLNREAREAVEKEFMSSRDSRKPWFTNLLSCTPTLEMGIDIGDLSTVLLCSVPPNQSNYLQRIGRSGRHDGNSTNVTIASARPHDLYYFMEPRKMIAGEVSTPGVFLAAAAVLERQLTAYCFDRWVESGIKPEAIDHKFGSVLDTLTNGQRKASRFPYNFFDFISANQSGLHESFLTLFEGQFTHEEHAEVSARLREFLQGDDAAEGSLSYKILNRLLLVAQECNNYRRDVQLLKSRIDSLEENPAQDEETRERLRNMKIERQGLSNILAELRKKPLFNLLTDEGLLPNYAFPEEGVTLRSVIYRRKRQSEDYDSVAYEYQRPAATAIHELAPSNHFYAGGRKVRIDQIELRFAEGKDGVNVTSSDLEHWRFCDRCSHMERERGEKPAVSCPHCASPMWADQGQLHQLVRMRQVFANTSYQDSLSGIEDEERTPQYFEKQLLVNFDPAHVQVAYKVKDDAYPFGFEFISRVFLREVNFGEKSQEFQASGDLSINRAQLNGQGFLLCKYCGKVQPRAARNNAELIQHAFSCRRPQGANRTKDLIESAYLYREFQSEALRIFLPDDPQFQGEICIQSFIAAINLGLRKCFSGNIDHLSATLYHEPIPHSDSTKNFLVLYDTVPGGTGYLKQLAKPAQMLSMLSEALNHLKACSCNQDEELDGCHQCILGYRNMRHLDSISRDAAVELLSTLLRYAPQLDETHTISGIASNVVLESELERRFIEALRRLKQEPAWAHTRMVPEIVAGKLGYLLQIGEHSYSIEPQAVLSDSDGVLIPSRPDFVLKPQRGGGSRAIAVFTDGYQFHRDRIDKDLAQRMALIRSGKYWVWSLTWKDIEAQLQLLPQTHAWNPLADQNPQSWAFVSRLLAQHHKLPAELLAQRDKGAFDHLIAYLANPDAQQWEQLAMGLSAGWIPDMSATPEVLKQAQRHWRESLLNVTPPEFFDHVGKASSQTFFPRPTREESGVELLLRLPKDAFAAGTHPELFQYLVLDDQDPEDPALPRRWNGLLRLFNLFQFMPNSWFVSRLGLDRQRYAPLFKAALTTPEPAGLSPAWLEVFDLTDSSLHILLRAASARGWPSPVAGYELTDERGKILAGAELAFEAQRIAFLLPEEMARRSTFDDQGWQVNELDEAVLTTPDELLDSITPLMNQQMKG